MRPLLLPRIKRWVIALSFAASVLGPATRVEGGAIFGFTDAALGGGFRWDFAPLAVGDLERSLDGGLRFSLEGGSYQALLNSFFWFGGPPALVDFQASVDRAFSSWTVGDPVTGLPGTFSFVPDLATPVVPGMAGAEIDVFATDLGDAGLRAFASFSVCCGPVTLTSGTTGYPGSAISGADITVNSNPGALYTLDLFRRLLTHEIGHALGLGDVEGDLSPGRFIDDNLDLTSGLTAQATLTNSWALLVDPFNPSMSLLGRFTVPGGDPGIGTLGVDILMESRGLGIGPTNPVSNLIPQTNDEYGTRQFLYPAVTTVPEPGTAVLVGFGLLGYCWRGRKRAEGVTLAPGSRKTRQTRR